MATETLRPNAAGDETAIASCVPGSGEAHWEDVDDVTPDGETTEVYTSAVAYERDLYNITNPSGSGTINSVTVYAYCARFDAGDQASLKIAIKTGGTAYESAQKTLSYNWATYSNGWATNPQTGVAWTWDDITSLQIGIALRRCKAGSAYPSYCTQVYVVVDYTTITAKTSSDSGAGAEASTQTATLTKAETGTGVEGLLARVIGLTETGAGLDVVAQAQAILGGAEVGSGADAYVSLLIFEARFSSDVGLGVEGAPMPAVSLAGSETGASIDAIIARLLTSFDTGYGVEAGDVEIEGLLQELFATELGQGIDALVVKREIFAGGEGTKFFGGGHEPPHRAS